MKKIFISFFLLGFFCTSAQKIIGNVSFRSQEYSSKLLDKSIQNFYYNLKFVSDKENNQNKREAIYILEVGDKYSKFTEVNNLKLDSLYYKFSLLSSVGSKEINETFNFKTYSKLVLLKNNDSLKNIFQNSIIYTYQYIADKPHFNWKLEKGYKEILGYKCQKATVKYGGRKYIAWYANDIPINNGPYVFQDLPGLILNLESEDGDYSFNLIGMDKIPKDIYIRNDKKIINTTIDKFKIVEKSYHDNPGFYIGKAYDENMNETMVKSQSIPYNPIELD